MERILQRWYDMISIRSVNGHEAQMADYVANVLRELGMDPHYSYFEEDTARERPSVWSVLDSGRPGKTVLLIGHLDTVDVSDRWKTDPYVVPGETDETCIAQIMEAAEQLGLSGKVDVRLKPRKSPYMQSFAVEEDHPLVKILQEEFYSVTGKDLPCAYDASVCDSNILAVSLGIPVVTFGPSGGNMHGDNEYGYAWQVKNCGEVYRRTVARLFSGEV